METQTFEIPEVRRAEFEKRFNRLVKLAGKCGSEVPTFTVMGEVIRAYYTETDESGRYRVEVRPRVDETLAQAFERAAASSKNPRYYTFLTVEVVGPQPKIAGWKFLAKLEHTSEGTMIQKLSDEPVPVQYREARCPACDHCNLNRIRRDTYVVKHESGETKQVGRSCLKDFMGHQSPENIAALCSYLEDLASVGEFDEELDDFSTGRVSNYSLKSILAMCACVIRTEGGYVSRAKAEESYPPRLSTASRIHMALGKHASESVAIKTEEMDWELAEKVAEWGAALEADETNDYLWNLSVIGRLGIVNYKRVGLAASMVVAYNRAMDLIEEKKRESFKPSDWFGQPKQKFTNQTVRVLSVKEFDTQYGLSTKYTFATENGDIATWFTGTGFPVQDGSRVIGRGDVLRINFTVKGHSDYFNQQKQETAKTTEILRVKLLELVADSQQQQAA